MSVLLLDTFTDADGTLLRNHTADTGGLWHNPYYDTSGFTDCDLEIRAGTVRAINSRAENDLRHYNEAVIPVQDCDVQFEFTALNDAYRGLFEIFARSSGTDVNHGIRAELYDSGASVSAVLRCNNVMFASADVAPPNPFIGTHTVRLSLAGDIISLYYDGVLMVSGNQLDAGYGPADGVGNVGFSLNSGWTGNDTANIRIDNFSVAGELPSFWTNFHGQREAA
jgi:hypothetical protein